MDICTCYELELCASFSYGLLYCIALTDFQSKGFQRTLCERGLMCQSRYLIHFRRFKSSVVTRNFKNKSPVNISDEHKLRFCLTLHSPDAEMKISSDANYKLAEQCLGSF